MSIRAQVAQNQHNNFPIVLVHGLFGSLGNLGILIRNLVDDHNIIQVDMRDHGLSSRDPIVSYPAMAQDLVGTLDAQRIDKATFIGRSVGGKTVTILIALTPDRIGKLVAIDIAPVDHHVCCHGEISAAINTVSGSDAQTRQQAAAIMCQYPSEEGVIQFLLKSLVDGEWRFNAPVLWDQYPCIVGREKIPAWDYPTLFVLDGNSPYVSEQYRDDLLAQFPQARTCVITGVGH